MTDKNKSDLEKAENRQADLVEKIIDKNSSTNHAISDDKECYQEVLKWLKYGVCGIGLTLVFVVGNTFFHTKPADQHTLIQVGKMIKANHDSIMRNIQSNSDNKSELERNISDLKASNVQMSHMLSQLSQNQQKIVDIVSHSAKVDLSGVNKKLDLITKKLNKNVVISSKKNLKSEDHDVFIRYVATSPNGAVLKIKDGSGHHFITVTPSSKSKYGDVTYVSDNRVILGGKKIDFDAVNPTIFINK